ncbi:sulfite exporter TauE/SafE family protein [Streptomyces sp. NPDC059690]|uniref:sulfite exporter TauE/SafE family protein n=1 Tax=Streptomyces sp. NPDC059690 TaxID=3346907 RepID=UPI0036A5FB11
MAVGGSVGAVLLLGTPSSAFERVVPWLIALGSVLILVREPLRRLTEGRLTQGGGPRTALLQTCCVLLVGLYGGYFGAASGVLMPAVLSLSADEPLRVTKAVKNIATGAADVTAAVAYAFLARSTGAPRRPWASGAWSAAGWGRSSCAGCPNSRCGSPSPWPGWGLPSPCGCGRADRRTALIRAHPLTRSSRHVERAATMPVPRPFSLCPPE